MNMCVSCGEDFSSVRLFDSHRVGVHAYLLSEGLRLDPPVEDGRRCLEVFEMQEAGWVRNGRGRWVNPLEARRTRASFEECVCDVSRTS